MMERTEYQIPPERPWFRFWPEGVPRHIEYPEIPLHELLSNTASRYPHNVGFSLRGNNLTYGELDELTNRLANGLSNLGVEKGDNIMLLLPNSLEFVVGYYGILKAGGTAVPVNPLCRASELQHYIRDSAAKCIITSKECYAIIKEIGDEAKPEIIILADAQGVDGVVSLQEILTKCSPTPPRLDLNPREDVAVIQYTGGTTGLPKGAMLTHYNLVSNAIQNAVWFRWGTDDTIVGLLPFYHSWGACTCVNSPIYVGARVILLPRFDAEELLKTIQQERATVLHGAASLFAMLVSNPLITKYDLSSLRYVKAGAMPIPPEIKQMWDQLTSVKMVLGYGLTEASPETHNSPVDRIKPGTVGIPICDTDARIVDQETGEKELPVGEIGELIIRGPQVMKGYLNRPDDNAEALRNGWLYTGDLALTDEEGYFHIVDRKKETIKYKGYTIAPAEVEAVLLQHPAVKECAVIGKPDPSVGEIPKAYVVLKEGYTDDPDELIRFCRERVAPYKRIREVEFINEIPKSPVGKILRRLLKERERHAPR